MDSEFLPGMDVMRTVEVELLGDEKFPLRRKRVTPSPPTDRGRPKRQYGPVDSQSGLAPPTRQDDPALWAVNDEILHLDPSGARIAYAIREALDQVYDGQRTGRWDYSQLMKTEKTHVGTLVEIWLQRELLFDDGLDMDFSIAGSDVDAKWSRNLYEWEIPLEMYSGENHIALLIWGNEYTDRWAAGLLRISDGLLKPLGKQRDRKRHLNDAGKDSILWVHRDMPMIQNTLLHLDPDVTWGIAVQRSGQQAVNALFREAQGVLINRAAVEAAGQQVDAQKRVRDARDDLRTEGIVVFGHYAPHPEMATALGLPTPTLGRFVSARVAPWSAGDPEPSAEIAGRSWRLARPDEPIGPAPRLPEQGRFRT